MTHSPIGGIGKTVGGIEISVGGIENSVGGFGKPNRRVVAARRRTAAAGLAKGGEGRENGGREGRSSRNNLFNRYARVRAKHTKWDLGRQNGVYFEKNQEKVWQEKSNAVSLHPLSR